MSDPFAESGPAHGERNACVRAAVAAWRVRSSAAAKATAARRTAVPIVTIIVPYGCICRRTDGLAAAAVTLSADGYALIPETLAPRASVAVSVLRSPVRGRRRSVRVRRRRGDTRFSAGLRDPALFRANRRPVGRAAVRGLPPPHEKKTLPHPAVAAVHFPIVARALFSYVIPAFTVSRPFLYNNYNIFHTQWQYRRVLINQSTHVYTWICQNCIFFIITSEYIRVTQCDQIFLW